MSDQQDKQEKQGYADPHPWTDVCPFCGKTSGYAHSVQAADVKTNLGPMLDGLLRRDVGFDLWRCCSCQQSICVKRLQREHQFKMPRSPEESEHWRAERIDVIRALNMVGVLGVFGVLATLFLFELLTRVIRTIRDGSP
jgi:hypothetical protein